MSMMIHPEMLPALLAGVGAVSPGTSDRPIVLLAVLCGASALTLLLLFLTRKRR